MSTKWNNFQWKIQIIINFVLFGLMDSSYARWWFWGWFSFQFCRKVVYGKNIFPQTKHLLYEKKKRMMVMCMFTYLQADKDKKFSVYVHSRPGFLFHKATTKSLFFLNRQVNNSVQVLFFFFLILNEVHVCKKFLCMFILDLGSYSTRQQQSPCFFWTVKLIIVYRYFFFSFWYWMKFMFAKSFCVCSF